MAARIIALGDIHGCAEAFRRVIHAIQPQKGDTLVTLGDCVDRGPDSRGVIDQLLALRGTCQLITILGNHEEMMLNWADDRIQPDNWMLCGGSETLASYQARENPRAIPPAHLDFIRNWVDFWECDSHFFVHGYYESDRPLPHQPWQVHRWVALRQAVPKMHVSGKTAIVGHSAQRDGQILDLGYLQCIDTYCHGGGWLTALDVTSGAIWQADRNGELRAVTV